MLPEGACAPAAKPAGLSFEAVHYDRGMNAAKSHRRRTRTVLIVLLSFAVVILGFAVAALLPMLTHEPAGASGQQVPNSFVSSDEATGDDGRTRVLSIEREDGLPIDTGALTAGDRIRVAGSGFDAGIGIYVAICGIPATPEEKPGPCLGGIPEGAKEGTADTSALTSAWITNDWAWRAFATQSYDNADAGEFTVTITVPPAVGDGIDCGMAECAISTRADHTASRDRVQDMLLPVAYRK